MTYDEWKATNPADRWLDDALDEDEAGCICRRTVSGWEVDRWCPICGLDIDAERKRIRDEDWR